MHRKRRTAKTGDGDILAELERAAQLTLPGFDLPDLTLSEINLDDLDRPIELPDLTLPEINLDDPLPDLDQPINLPDLDLDLSAAIVAPLLQRRRSRRHA